MSYASRTAPPARLLHHADRQGPQFVQPQPRQDQPFLKPPPAAFPPAAGRNGPPLTDRLALSRGLVRRAGRCFPPAAVVVVPAGNPRPLRLAAVERPRALRSLSLARHTSPAFPRATAPLGAQHETQPKVIGQPFHRFHGELLCRSTPASSPPQKEGRRP